MHRYVVVEGLIGAGKTTLCRLLAQAHDAELVLEPHEDNPFLEPFYRDPDRYALPVQMSFMLTRFRQQDTIRQLGLYAKWVVSDYLFDKDRLFAEKTLSPSDLEIYDQVTRALAPSVVTPDLVVALHAPVSVLLRRIEARGVAGEEHINRAYLEDLARRYRRLWEGWSRCPVLHIDNTELPYDRDEGARRQVLRRIEAALEGEASEPQLSDEAWPSLYGPMSGS